MAIDNDAAAVLWRFGAVALLSALAAALETPAARTPGVQRLRLAVLGTFGGVALAGFLVGPMGPFGAPGRARPTHDDGVCTDRALTVLACARDHDMRRRW